MDISDRSKIGRLAIKHLEARIGKTMGGFASMAILLAVDDALLEWSGERKNTDKGNRASAASTGNQGVQGSARTEDDGPVKS